MKNARSLLPTVFLTPAMAILAVLALVPTVYAVFISFQDRELSRPDGRFIGLENYIALFSDRRFLNAIKVSLTWEILTVALTLVIAVGLGILLFECASAKMRNFLSLLFLMPVILPRVSAAFVWKFAFHPLYGIITYPYKAITGQPLDLLSNPFTALGTVALVDVWQWGLFFAVIVLKLLETLPPQPFEAARLDHAKTWEIYAYVALPMLKAPLISLAFVKMIESLRAFDLIYVMTRGGPGISTETLDMYAFSQGFIESGRISYASSMAVLMMIATSVAFTFIWKRAKI
ncbi:carbohydrate ABC transporter permease [Neorhizobium alkalisoli]|uniref:Carbohydrate ABC transporter membrane protein 1 (CUT1 family) n=1 Tax=Neorhizobium alkalisoli TaxID=528178 RepID=A0A561R7T1_9HYPH|nr:sugar ABC transporter permease [Neorhizobium alkalisoli]TWF58642.1 carbohydrate ABC transporter membrane protein 1 (CUT1 family) [Neorhizobium alkalisoli]